MATQPDHRQPALFAYQVDLEARLAPDHLLRQVAAVLDLSFVLPAVRHCYGLSGNESLDPRLLVKLMLLLFLYDVRSERELMEQVALRLDFLWFLGLDLDSEVPHHSVLSKARARWGAGVFEQLFVRTVLQCTDAGLVAGRLLHLDSTMVRAQAHKDSILSSSPELIEAVRRAYRQQEAKLEVLSPAPAPEADPGETPAPELAALGTPAVESLPREPMPVTLAPAAVAAPTQPTGAPAPVLTPEPQAPLAAPTAETAANPPTLENAPAPTTPSLRVLPPPPPVPLEAPLPRRARRAKGAGKKPPVNRTRLSTTDPEAELARSKNGLSELNYKEHRLVDDAHGVITAVAVTTANVADGTQLPGLYAQHLATSGLKLDQVTVAGDHHYGTADNYLFCAQAGLRPHLGPAEAHVEKRGKLSPSQFVYEPEADRLRCPQGHYLVLHQHRPEEQVKVYLIEEAAACTTCPLRAQCTDSPQGRSIRRHVQAEVVAAGQAEATSPAGRYSRRRRQHVMEGNFADAVNNHGAKQARWRGLGRQQIQSWLIAAVQNLRLLLRRRVRGPFGTAAALAGGTGQGAILKVLGLIGPVGGFGGRSWAWGPVGIIPAPFGW